MKYLFLSFLVLSFCQQCGKRPTGQHEQVWIEYTAESRGSFIRYRVDTYYFEIHSKGLNTYDVKHEIRENYWMSLYQLIQDSKYEKWSEIVPNSPKYQVDASAIATLNLYKNGKRYTTLPFDHENPPKQLKPIVNKILELANSVE